MFWKRKHEEFLNSAEYESVAKKITGLSTELEELKAKFKVLETNYDNLRGNFNRKLAGLKKEDVSDDSIGDKPQSQSINNPVILPENGIFFKHR